MVLNQKRAQSILIFRPEFTVSCEVLTDTQFFLLKTLQQGTPLGAACEKLTLLEKENDPASIQTWFAHWMQSGIFGV